MTTSGNISLTYLTGVMKLEPEFVWISRKTIRGWFRNKYEYSVHTPYVKIGATDLEDAEFMRHMVLQYV